MDLHNYQDWIAERQQLLERIKELEEENAELKKRLGEDVVPVVQAPTAMQTLSLQEKVSALYELVCSTYEETDNEWYGLTCYENPNYVIMHGYFNGRHYKQAYKVENDEYSLIGDRVQVFEQFLTQEEVDELDRMRANYSALVEYKANAEKSEFEARKNNLIEDSRFDIVRETDEFKSLVAEVEKYSVEELETKLKLVVADFALGNGNTVFSKQTSGKMFTIPNKTGNSVTSKYGGIFSEQN